MLAPLLIGSAVICLTIFVQAAFIGVASHCLARAGEWFLSGRMNLKLMTSLTVVVLWMLLGLSIAVWIWGGTFFLLGQFDDFETSLYFSVVSFTTIGFGDVVLSTDWRLLSGLTAANGLILFSLTTAYLIEFILRMRRAQDGRSK
jgi:hypothetical protein